MIASELPQRSNKKSTDEALSATHPITTSSALQIEKVGYKQGEIANKAGVNQSTISRKLSGVIPFLNQK